MNFLSHYYRVQDEALYYKFGTMLPDLYHNFSFFYNKHIAEISPRSHVLKEDQDLHYGILNHYNDDKIFHQLPIFKNFIFNSITYFEQNEVLKSIKRKNFVAHIFFEILLDHLCIEAHPHILKNFYNDMKDFDKKIIFNFLEKSIPSSETNVLFLRNFDNFLDIKYMNFYAEESNLLKALHAITGKIGQWELNSETKEQLMIFIQKSKKEYNFQDVEKQMNDE